MNALVTIDSTLTPAIFAQEGGIDAMLASLKAEVRAVATDISTPAGRKAVASLAFKVARSKTAFDAMGKGLAAEWKQKAKVIDTERARVWDELEALQAEVRKPLDDYEADEAKRIADHQSAIQAIIDLTAFGTDLPESAAVIAALTELEALPERDWQEFKQRAATARSETFARLQALKSAAVAREEQAAELARLRAEQVAREQKEREDRIAAEAAAKATREAEERAEAAANCLSEERAEQERKVAKERADALAAAERAQQAATDRAIQAERDRLAAVAEAEQAGIRMAEERAAAARKAEEERIAAIAAERQRVADEAAAEAAETARREADKAHKKAINNEAKAALVAAGLSSIHAEEAIKAIALGQVPNVKISY